MSRCPDDIYAVWAELERLRQRAARKRSELQDELEYLRRREAKQRIEIERLESRLPWRLHGESRLETYPADLTDEEAERIARHPDEALLHHATRWEGNLIVNTAASLIAALFKNQAGYEGITHVVVGEGLASWDTTSVPTPTPGQTQMVSELGRVDAVVVFIDANSVETLSVTNRLQISGSFGPTSALGAWREWGLVGGTATAAADSGLLVDYNTHAIETKGATTKVRRIRITITS